MPTASRSAAPSRRPAPSRRRTRLLPADTSALTGLGLFVVGALVGLGVFRSRIHRGRDHVATWAAQHGYVVVDTDLRWVNKGPFLLTTWQHQQVFRVTLRRPDGAVVHGWAKTNTAWFWSQLSSDATVVLDR